MRGIQKSIYLAAVLMLMATFLYGCNESERNQNPEFPETLEQLSTQMLGSNERFSFTWDREKCCIFLEEKSTGKVWSSILDGSSQGTEVDEDMNSPIYIQYVDSSSMLSVTDKGYTDCVSEGRFASEMMENGVKVTYYFDKAKISVPVIYTLREEAMAVTVDFEHVKEGANKLLSVSIAPYLCSVKNGAEDSYIVVPSGSGALMYTDERAEGVRTWQGEIYGSDPARIIPEELNDDEKIRLPFFGVKDGEDAMLAIVEKGDEAAFLTANAGNDANGHSNIYVSFYARGYDILESQTAWALSDVYRTEEEIHLTESTVAFYPLMREEADYTGMAMNYREYLKEQGLLQTEAQEQAYALYMTGGAGVKELVAGIPITGVKALTTYKQAQHMIDEMIAETGSVPDVQLKGFGKSGLDAEKPAGDFSFASAFGTEEERQALEEQCKEKKVRLFTDFDLVYFRKSGSGLHTLLDVAKSASSHKVKIYQKNKALWHYDEDAETSYLVGRKHLKKLTERLIQTVEKKGISGISLATLGQTAYSDYSNDSYSTRGNTSTDVRNTLSELQNHKIPVAVEQANAYAASISDCVFSVPVNDGAYVDIDVYVPLYQIVFKGSTSLYSIPVNTTENYEKTVAQAVASGTSLGFSVVGEYDSDFAYTKYKLLYASSYTGNKDKMIETIKHCADYYEAIQGATIVNYEYLSQDVSVTNFDNGVTVYVNHGSKIVDSPLGELKAYGFSYTSEGK